MAMMDPAGLIRLFCFPALPTRWNRQPEEHGKGHDGACGAVDGFDVAGYEVRDHAAISSLHRG